MNSPSTQNFCPNCGHGVSPAADHCPSCGHPLPGARAPKSKAAAILLCLFLGQFGAHQFYMGHKLAGFAYFAILLIGLYDVGSGQPWGAMMLMALAVLCLVDLIVLICRGRAWYAMGGATK